MDNMTGFNEKAWVQVKKSTWAGQKLIYKEETDSTNSEAARLTDELAHGTVIVAEAQTAGRGRRGRTWVSGADDNLYFSLLLKPDFAPELASMLTLVMAEAVAEGIEASCNLVCQIKWPNDIVLHGKKVCGILTEMQVEAGHIKHVIIGVGVNVNQMEFAGEGLKYAGSLRRETGVEIDRAKLLSAILGQFEGLYEVFGEAGSLAPLKGAYQERLANYQKEVKVLDPRGAYQGVALGINDKGELLVCKKDGIVKTVFAGEVSVRGLLGYV